MHLKWPWEYISRDMNWRGAVVGLAILVLLMVDFAMLGSATAGYVCAAVIVVVSAVTLRATAHRRGRGRT
jgi:hypothetical protein